jgi:hypothetical protein
MQFVLLSLLAMTCVASDFDGTWVHRIQGRNIFKLELTTEGGRTKGSLTKPKQIDFSGGEISHITAAQVTHRVQEANIRGGQLELKINGDVMTMTLQGPGRASLLIMEALPSFELERIPDGSVVSIATSLPQPDYPAGILELRRHLESMVKADQDVRLKFDDAGMKAVDDKNRTEVMHIFEQYGWVTNSLAGKDASHNFWLLVQHQTPEIQRRLLPELEKAAKAVDASMSDYAYLYDRVQIGLGRPQHWGSSVSCKNGKPVLDSVDDLAGLDARRKEIFLMPIDEYLKESYLKKMCAKSRK